MIYSRRGIVRGIFDERQSLEERSSLPARVRQSCHICAGCRRLRLVVNADRRSRSVESSARSDRGDPLCHHQRCRAGRRSDGNSDDAQTGSRTGSPSPEARPTGNPRESIGFSRSLVSRHLAAGNDAEDSCQLSLHVGVAQRMLTKAAHMAANMAPARR
jgi:hypothetical protein